MDNWLVTAVAAATTALGALVTSLGVVPPPGTVPSAASTQHTVAPARPGPGRVRAVAPVQASVTERPSRSASGHRARHVTHRRAHRRHRRAHHGAHHRAHLRAHHRRHRGTLPAAHRRAHRRTRPHPRVLHPTHRQAPRRARHVTAHLIVRLPPTAVHEIDGVPARQVIGIRQALGMRPAMGDLGSDISWPQCGGLPMPLAAARFVVIGLTDGPAFSPNHCLGRQATWVRRHHRHAATYAVVSYPSRRELARYGGRGPFRRHRLGGRLRNVGYQQAMANLSRMQRAGLHSPILWIDLEPSSTRPWRGRTGLNAAVVRGLVQGYRSRGQRIGFYSTASIWHTIVGRLRFGAPEWRTAGPASPGAALGRCHERDASIQGGPAVLAQWWNDRRDHDLLCPGYQRPSSRSQWFEVR